MNAILQYMNAHWKELTAAGTLLVIALVSCMPEDRPKSIDDWYAYFRHALQTAIPAARVAATPQAHIQTTQITPDSTRTEDSTYPVPLAQPENPAQSQK